MKREEIKELSIILKEIRIHNKEILNDMANKLEFSSTFLSAIENGRKKVPEDFYEKIIKKYNLTDDEKIELEEAIYVANQKIDISLNNKDVSKQKLAISFARSFDEMDEETIKLLQDIIDEKRGE